MEYQNLLNNYHSKKELLSNIPINNPFYNKIQNYVKDLKSDLKPIVVNVQGERGVGKSTIINSLINKHLLSTDKHVHCTFCPTILKFSENWKISAKNIQNFDSFIKKFLKDKDIILNLIENFEKNEGPYDFIINHLKQKEECFLRIKNTIETIRNKRKNNPKTEKKEREQEEYNYFIKEVNLNDLYFNKRVKPLTIYQNFKKIKKDYSSGKCMYSSIIIEGPMKILKNGLIIIDFPGITGKKEPYMSFITNWYLENDHSEFSENKYINLYIREENTGLSTNEMHKLLPEHLICCKENIYKAVVINKMDIDDIDDDDDDDNDDDDKKKEEEEEETEKEKEKKSINKFKKSIGYKKTFPNMFFVFRKKKKFANVESIKDSLQNTIAKNIFEKLFLQYSKLWNSFIEMYKSSKSDDLYTFNKLSQELLSILIVEIQNMKLEFKIESVKKFDKKNIPLINTDSSYGSRNYAVWIRDGVWDGMNLNQSIYQPIEKFIVTFLNQYKEKLYSIIDSFCSSKKIKLNIEKYLKNIFKHNVGRLFENVFPNEYNNINKIRNILKPVYNTIIKLWGGEGSVQQSLDIMNEKLQKNYYNICFNELVSDCQAPLHFEMKKLSQKIKESLSMRYIPNDDYLEKIFQTSSKPTMPNPKQN